MSTLQSRFERQADAWWRVGFYESPLDFVPRDVCCWDHRFDDPLRKYRTLYAAAGKQTALREVLAPLRPDARTRADFDRFQAAQGIEPEHRYEPARALTQPWRAQHVLVPARLLTDGAIADLDDVRLRAQLERTHRELLTSHGMDHFDISEVRSKNRPVTQAVSRDLYERGAAAIRFRSNLDDRPCIVALEGRARFVERGPAIPLVDDLPELLEVCADFGIPIAPAAKEFVYSPPA